MSIILNQNSDWLNKFAETFVPKEDEHKIDRVNVSNELSEKDLYEERKYIEACASSKKIYAMNSVWSQEVKDHLKEYASIFEVPVKEVKKNEIRDIVAGSKKTISTDEPMIVTASKKLSPEVSELSQCFDPFGLTELENTEESEKEDWQVISAAQKLNYKPSINGGIIPVRGGEMTTKHSDWQINDYENSVVDSNAISKYAKKEQKSGKDLIAEEKSARKLEKENDRKQWEQDVIDSMEAKHIIASGNVFMTEASSDNQSGVLLADNRTLPEFTDGERIKSKNEDRRSSISRKKDDYKWEKNAGEATYEFSDDFANELAKFIK
jgi:hypothetical protein